MPADHTSAALFNLIRLALNDMNLVKVDTIKLSLGEAVVPHNDKLSLLTKAYEAGGTEAILSIGRYISTHNSVLAVAVLHRASDPLEAVHRWQRLEKMYHSRHRVTLLAHTITELKLSHVATKGPAPGQLEDLLIAGITLSLLEQQGCLGITATFGNGDHFVRNSEICYQQDLGAANYSTWCFRWDSRVPQQLPEFVLPPDSDGSLSQKLKSIFQADPAYPWTVAKFSQGVGLSSRTLQRRLAKEGTSVQVFLRDLRANTAAAMFNSVEASLTEIAFACGYSDQSHFTREFKRCIGMSPGRYKTFLQSGE